MHGTDVMVRTDAHLECLYNEYSRFVYKEAWKFHNNTFDVDDLVQEVWLKLCRKVDLLTGYSSAQLNAYLSVVVRNTAISSARKRHIHLSLDEADNIPYFEAEALHDNIDRLIRIQVFRQLWPSVPPQARELLERKYILQESDAEIAYEMGIHKNSVRMYLTRARKTAHAILSQHREALL